MTRKIITIAIMATLIAAVLAQAAFAAGQTYVDKRRVIRAGVLEVRTGPMTVASAPMPHIFYIMGMREDIKPQGWTFVNPLAGGKDSFKNVDAYWKVRLPETTLENLAKFDILYLSTNQGVIFPMSDRDKLRRFVDGGGCLWVDNGGGMSFVDPKTNPADAAFAFFLPDVNFAGGGGAPNLLARLHPLVTNPFWLGPDEIASISRGSAVINPGFPKDFGSLPSPTILCPLVLAGADTPSVAAIEYGSGRVVFTSGFIGGKIEGQAVVGAPDVITTQNSNLLRADPASLRFAYNVVSWATSYTTLRKNPRRTGVSLESVGAPLVNKWMVKASPGSGELSPTVWKNVIFYSDGRTLYAIDASPEQDLDMDGNPDDGEPYDSTKGKDYDIIWTASLGGEISSPTVASMLVPGTNSLAPKDFVLVSCSDGFVHVFEALPAAGDGRLSSMPVDRTADLWKHDAWTAGSGALLPPVVQNGWIVAAGQDGKIYGYSPVLDAAPAAGLTAPAGKWTCPLVISTDPSITATIKYGPTFGFIKNKTTGAVVQMLSVVAKPPNLGGSGAPDPGDAIYTLPIFISSDRLTPISKITAPTGDPVIFKTSFGNLPVSSYPAPEVWAVDAAGTPVSVTLQDYTTNPGQVTVQGALGPNIRVYLTYGVDYSQVNNTAMITYTPPQYLIPPTMPMINGLPGPIPEGLGTPALGPNDSFYMGVNWTGTGMDNGTGKSAIYSIWYDGKTSILKWNYFLHGGWEVPGATGDSQFWGIYARPSGGGAAVAVQNLEVVGTPAVMHDRVFVTATSSNPGTDLSKGYLICLKSDPDFIIRINRPLKDAATGRNLSVRLWQPDLMFSAGATVEPVLSAQPVPREMIDYDSGTITITDFSKIRQPTMGAGGAVQMMGGTFTPSLPVWAFVDNSPVPPEELDLSNWDNIIWSFAVPDHVDASGSVTQCKGVSSSPVVMGDYVYFTCDDGYLFAVAVDASPKDHVLDSTDSNWDNWVPMKDPIDPTAAGGVKANVSIAGAGGMLAVPGPQGLYGFANKLTLITDNHRVLEVGDDGRVYWACDSVYELKEAAGVIGASPYYGVQPQSLDKPYVAQKYSPSDYLVVESGSDRVIRMDRGGQVMWSLKRFDDSFKNLLRSGEPKTLSGPTDARMWGEFENIGGKWYYMSHCLIVDTGNFRILDVVDRFEANAKAEILGPVNPDAEGRPIHELNWVSRTTYREKRLSFSSVQLVTGADSNGKPISQIWASISNYGLTGVQPDSPLTPGGGHLGGAIARLKYRESTAPYEWNYLDGSIDAQLTSLTDPVGKPVALSGPTYFAVLNPIGPKLLICDSSTIYETQNPTGDIVWSFNATDYANLARKINVDGKVVSGFKLKIPFMPQRAQVLPGGNRVLIVNSYAGRSQDPKLLKFVGEVFEIDKDKSKPQIYWYTPEMHKDSVSGEIMQRMKNAPNLDQPTCAQRLF